MVNHSKEFIDRRTGCNTNAIESIWNKCKSKIRAANGINRGYVQEYLDEVMWRHNECLFKKKDKKKELKFTRRNAFRKMLNLLHVKNLDILQDKLKELAKRKKEEKHSGKQLRSKFLSEEFILKKTRIKNLKELLNDPTALVSRSTQTDASVFDYPIKQKNREVMIVEPEKIFDPNCVKIEVSTQTDMTPYVEKLVPRKKSKITKPNNNNYNLRKRKK